MTNNQHKTNDILSEARPYRLLKERKEGMARRVVADIVSTRANQTELLDYFSDVYFQKYKCSYRYNHKLKFVFARRILEKCLTLDDAKCYVKECVEHWELYGDGYPRLGKISSKKVHERVIGKDKEYKDEDF